MSSNSKPTAQTIVRALIEIAALSQENIARELEVSVTTVNSWSTGKRTPKPKQLESLLAFVRQTSARIAGQDKLRATLLVLQCRYGAPRVPSKQDPLDELFSLLVSLKSTHKDAEVVYSEFHAAFHPWERLEHTDVEDVNAQLRSAGLGSIKARSFIDIAKRLKTDFGSVTLAPLQKMDSAQAESYLRSLPSVGQKTARWVLAHCLGRDVLPADSKTYRVGVRLGVVPASTSTAEVHASFDKIVPSGFGLSLHLNLLALAEDACAENAPACAKCPASEFCEYSKSRAAALPAREAAAAVAATRTGNDGRLRAVDLYAGCGGLSAGLEDAGFHVAYALDWDKHACATHEHNFPETIVECRDVREVTGQHIESVAGKHIELVAGGPNCQGVSERGLRNPDDPRNFMFPEFVRLVSELRPRFFLMENVPGLAHRHNFHILQNIFSAFGTLQYRCAADVLLAADYGVPQLRYRFFMVGTLDPDVELSLPAPTHHGAANGELFARRYVPVWDAIGDLPDVGAERQDDVPLPYESLPQTDYQRFAREGSTEVHNHICSATEKINLDRAQFIPEGGNWKDIPAKFLPPRFFTCRMTDHSTTYARLRRDQPSFTITSLFGNITSGAFTHPLRNRALTIREGARLQSFRDRFRFMGPRNSQYRQIGNAVPTLLGQAVGRHILRMSAGEKVASIRPRITDACLSDKRYWQSLPVLTPRFSSLFGTGTRWPIGWGPEPKDYATMLDNNYSLRQEFWPPHLDYVRRRPSKDDLDESI